MKCWWFDECKSSMHIYIYILRKNPNLPSPSLQIGRASLLLVGDEIMGLQQRHDGIHILQRTGLVGLPLLGARCFATKEYSIRIQFKPWKPYGNPMKTYKKTQIPANHVKVEQTQLRSVEHGWTLQKCSPAQTYPHTHGGSPPTFPAPSLQRSRHPCIGHHGGTARHSESSPTWELAMASSVHQNGHPKKWQCWKNR